VRIEQGITTIPSGRSALMVKASTAFAATDVEGGLGDHGDCLAR
jgi:hypothetical protein